MAQASFPITTYQDPSGAALSNGYLTLSLNRDGVATLGSVVCQLASRRIMNVPLDPNGVIQGTPQFPTNGTISPSGTYYILSAYTASGQLALGPMKVTV